MKSTFSIDCKHAFYFNERNVADKILDTLENHKLQLIIDHQEVVLNLDWDYLNKIEPLLIGS